jgi:putative peptidoglycan lipid II flippase
VATTLRSSANVSVAILASRVLGVVRDSIFARIFGVSALTDAYVAAFRIPNLLRDLFAEGALSSAFVPTFAMRWRRAVRSERIDSAIWFSARSC